MSPEWWIYTPTSSLSILSKAITSLTSSICHSASPYERAPLFVCCSTLVYLSACVWRLCSRNTAPRNVTDRPKPGLCCLPIFQICRPSQKGAKTNLSKKGPSLTLIATDSIKTYDQMLKLLRDLLENYVLVSDIYCRIT